MTNKHTMITLGILGITAVVLSRGFFAMIDDPEGPNLLIVTVLALVLFGPAWAVYRYTCGSTNLKRFGFALITQIVLVTICYLLLR